MYSISQGKLFYCDSGNWKKRKRKKEWFYRFDNTTNIDMIVMLNTDVPTKLIIFDDEMNIKFLSDLPYKNKLYIRGFHINQIVGIVGEGDVAISFEPINQ